MQFDDIKVKDSIRVKSWEELEELCRSSGGTVDLTNLFFRKNDGFHALAFHHSMREMCDKVLTVKSRHNSYGGYIYTDEFPNSPLGIWAFDYVSGHDPIDKITSKELDKLLEVRVNV